MPIIKHKLVLLLACMILGGCSGLVTRSAANLTTAVLDHDDPGTVRAGAPAYLLLMDSLVVGSPDNKAVLRSAADLYSAYAAMFVSQPDRGRRLTMRAHRYGHRAFCLHNKDSCDMSGLDFEEYETLIDTFDHKDLPFMFSLAQSWLAKIRAYSTDLRMIAELPKAEALLKRVLDVDDTYANGTAHVYMGILNTLRPSALGGKPEEGRRHFERALELSGGRNLAAKVQYAESYARLVFNRELHDRLLKEVLESDAEQERFTLMNVFAKQRAEALLESADDYF